MAATGPAKTYRLRVGSKTFEDLTVGVVVKNIRNGKLRPQHLIAPAGTERWTPLGSVPQLKAIFTELGVSVEQAPPEPKQTQAAPVPPPVTPAPGQPAAPSGPAPPPPAAPLDPPAPPTQHAAPPAPEAGGGIPLSSFGAPPPSVRRPGDARTAFEREVPRPDVSAPPPGQPPPAEPADAPAEPGAVRPSAFDIRKGDQVKELVPRRELVEMIRQGELKETDQIRRRPDGRWEMAGDMAELHKLFDFRRRQVASGAYGKPKKKRPPFYIDLGAPFVYIGSLRFLINIGVIVALFGFADFVAIPIIAGPIRVLTSFYLFAYYFRVVSDAAMGGEKFPDFIDFTDLVGDLVRPWVQFTATRIAALSPLGGYLFTYKAGGLLGAGLILMYIQILLISPWLILVTPDMSGFEFEMPDLEQFQTPEDYDYSEIPPDMRPTALEPASQEEFGPEQFEAMIPQFKFFYQDPIVWACLAFWLLFTPIALMRQAAYGAFLPPLFQPYAVFVSIGRAFWPYLTLIIFMLIIDVTGIAIVVLVVIMAGLGLFTAATTAGPQAAMQGMNILAGPMGMLFTGIFVTGTLLKMYFIGRFVFDFAERMGWD